MNNVSYRNSQVLKPESNEQKQKPVKETGTVKPFTSADLWNIQRMVRHRTGRRFIG